MRLTQQSATAESPPNKWPKRCKALGHYVRVAHPSRQTRRQCNAGVAEKYRSLSTLSRLRKNAVLAQRVVEFAYETRAVVAENRSSGRLLHRFCRFLSGPGRFRAWLRHDRHQLGQPDQVVGCGRQREHPADASQATVMGLAKAGGRLGPAKHLLDALAHPPTDRITGVAGRPAVDRRPPVGGVLRHMRCHAAARQTG